MRHKVIKAKIPVLMLEEKGQYVAFTPALDLSTCGKTIKKAKERFAEMLELFFEELEEMGTLDDVLSDCGWRKVYKPLKSWMPPKLLQDATYEVVCHAWSAILVVLK